MRVIPRSEWRAKHPDGQGAAPIPAPECWLHHSVTATAGPNGTFAQDAANIRAIEAVGHQRFGYGISYTWLITQSGRVFQGHSPARMGTHTGGRNSAARAICLVGNYDIDVPTAAQVQAIAWLLQEAKRQGWLRNARLNGGHRDLKATACPGARAYSLIPQINGLAAGLPVKFNEGDVLSWTENLTFTAPDGKVTTLQARDWILWTNYYANLLPAMQAMLAQVLAAVTEGDVDQAAILERVDKAVREATEKAMTERIMPVLQATAESILAPEVSEDLVQRFVREMGEQLAGQAPPSGQTA